MRILDRFILGRARFTLVFAAAAELVGWFPFGPVGASIAATFVVAIGLAIVYGTLAKSGEFGAIVAAGIPPRRAIRSIVALMALLGAIEALLACTLRPSSDRSVSVGYGLAAIVPAITASIVLPIAARARNEEPWAIVFLLLVAYTLAIASGTIMERSGALALGLSWIFIDGALIAADMLLYRTVFQPRAGP